MRLKPYFITILFTIFLCVLPTKAQELSDVRPLMSDDKEYTEYWEQYFYLSDGSLVTNQFLVANFTWPVGKDHGIMLGTLVTPTGELYVIKNGRDLGKWGYSEDGLNIFIHTHRLKGKDDQLSVHLENTMGIVDLDLKSNQKSINHKRFSSDNGFVETSIFAPSLTGKGNWQLGPEAGFNPSGPVNNVENVSGFGVHVLMTDKVDALIKNWSRFIGVSEDNVKPFMSAITRPDGTEDIVLKLFNGGQVVDSFSEVKLTYDNLTSEKNASYPKSIKISATGENGTLSGTVEYDKKLAHFNLTEHLNFFEKSFAKSNPEVSNFRYLADYNLIYKTKEGESNFTGKALNEYTDIITPTKSPKKRRRSRR